MASSFVLTIAEGSDSGQRIELVQRSLLIGRDPSCDLVINDVEVSRRHARLIAQSGGYAVEDLGSTNGTFVDEQRIKNVVPLKSGAIIRLGDSVRLAFEEARPDEAETRGLATEPKEAALHTIRPMFAPPLEAPGEPAPMAGPATLEPEAALASVPRRPRRKGLRLPIFSKPWMLILVILLSSGLCMAVFLFFVDVFNLWCSWFSWALSACS